MPRTHTVAAGDCISSIAKRYGVRDYKEIWDHSDNSQLKTDRPNPNVLSVGDTVIVPDPVRKEIDGATGQKHRFKIERKEAKTLFRMNVIDQDGNGLADKTYKLSVDGSPVGEGKTDSGGAIEHPIAADARAAELCLWLVEGDGIDGYCFAIQLGELAHESDDVACKQRLANLAYDCRSTTAAIDDDTVLALKGYQKDAGIVESGALDDGTREGLRIDHEGE